MKQKQNSMYLNFNNYIGMIVQTNILKLRAKQGEGNSVVFHLSFLTHSACQYDVT